MNDGYNIPPEEVTDSVWCLVCLQRLPSDEEACINHMVGTHGAAMGTMIREMTRFSVTKFDGITVMDLVNLQLIREESIQPQWQRSQ